MACPTCGEDGDYFIGTNRAERLHFIRRALWALHRARQAFQPDSIALADELSHIIQQVDAVAVVALDLDPNA